MRLAWCIRFVAYLLLLAVVGELILRLAWNNPHAAGALPARSVLLKENARDSIDGQLRTDADGFVLPSRTLKRGAYLLAFLGDSTVEAATLPPEQRWVNLVIGALRQLGMVNADALTDAHAGCTVRDAVELFYNKDAYFRPPILVYSSGFTDLAYNVVHGGDPPRLVQPQQQGFELSDLLLSHSYLCAFLAQRWTVGIANPVQHGSGLPAHLYAGDCRAAVGEFRRNLTVLVRVARASGSRVYLLTQPSIYGSGLMAREPGRVATIRYKDGGLDEASLEKAMDQINQAVREVASSEGAEVIDAAKAIGKDEACFQDEVHLTALGQHRVGDVVLAGLLPYFQAQSAAQPPAH